MKKVISILLVLVLALGVFTACSNEEDPAETTGDTEATTNDATSGDSGEALSGIVSTGGSTSVEKVMTALIYQFQEDNPDVTINYEMNGSGDGIANTISGMYEIGHSSRDLKTDGTEDGLVATAYAIDGIAVVVHQDNEVESLNADQLRDIYTGTITNWSQVGGADAPITVVTREASSGTRSAFAEIIGLEEDDATAIVASATTCDSTGAVQTTVSQNDNAIGYMSFSDVDTTKVKTVQFDGVEISTETLKDDSYKLKREFYLVTKEGATLSAPAQAFIDFVLSDAGQQLVTDNNLLPVD